MHPRFAVWQAAASSRSGHAAVLLSIVMVVAAIGVVVMSISARTSETRATNRSRSMGRVASGLAESAIAECLARFPRIAKSHIPPKRMRAHLLSRARGGIVPGDQVLGSSPLLFTPKKTRELMREDLVPVSVTDVEVVPLYYSIVQNYGEVELTASAQVNASPTHRRVTARHYILMDVDGTCRVNHVPIQTYAFRSAEP